MVAEQGHVLLNLESNAYGNKMNFSH